ncbi:hypothetical protein [Marinovum sp.]|uniref:hypothetical protein n=1 Tax=Marinovum sp. TaxID=2024839 RepID=UPI003A8D4F6A
MAQKTTILEFRTSNQSLWAPGEALSFSVDTGDTLIFDPPETVIPFDIDVAGNGVEADLYVDLVVGLYAYASLGEMGRFDAALNMAVDVDYSGGVLLPTQGGPSAPATMAFDFTSYSLIYSKLESVGFGLGAKAGLDLVLGIEAGLRDGEFYHWFGDDTFDDVQLIDLDWSTPGETSLPLIELSLAKPEIEKELSDGITFKGRLPTGADTASKVLYDPGDAPVIESSGFSGTQFLSLEVDLDELLVKYGSKIPGAGAVIKGLGETVFAEHNFDLHDYIPFIPAKKFVLAATALDIGASAGTVVTEDLRLDFGNGTDTPDVRVTLRSDNGTPGYTHDDIIVQSQLGQIAEVPRPIYVPGATGEGAVPDIGEITVGATFQLQNVELTHAIGLGLNTVFNITALSAELQGDWVPSSLQFSIGPVLSLELPEGGFNQKLADLYSDSFTLAQDAFRPTTDIYKVFFTNELAPRQTSEAELEAPNARQAILDYRAARTANEEAARANFQALWNNDQAFPVATLQNDVNNTVPEVSGDSYAVIWDGGTNAQINLVKGDRFFIVQPNEISTAAGAGRLQSSVSSNLFSDAALITPMVGFDASDGLRKGLLASLSNPSMEALVYHWVWDTPTGEETHKELRSLPMVEVQGGSLGDTLVYHIDAQGQARGQYFDGGGNDAGEHDLFVADFRTTDPDLAIEWNLAEAVQSGNGAELPNGITVRNVEALTVYFGDGADKITNWIHSDILYLGDGDDVVFNVGDTEDDWVYSDGGDDLVVSFLTTPGGHDRFTGFIGTDTAMLDASGGLGRLQVDISDLSGFTFGGTGIGALASLDDLNRLEDALQRFLGFQDVDGVGAGDASSRLLRYILDDEQDTGFADVEVTFEEINAIGSDAYDDLIVYAGGSSYAGGDGGSDTLLANFFHTGTTQGVEINLAPGSGGASDFTVGSASFAGFERAYILGTGFDDLLIGGGNGDFFNGLSGDDVIFGGDDLSPDVLMGGHGSDAFYWQNNGGDLIYGFDDNIGSHDEETDRLFLNFGGADAGIRYGFLDAPTQFGGEIRTLRDGTGFYGAASGTSGIVEAMAQASRTDEFTAMTGHDTDDLYYALAFHSIEAINVIGTQYDDLIIYTGGAEYHGHEEDSVDTFAADFSDALVGFDLRVASQLIDAVTLANGVRISGFERMAMKTGEGHDILHGGQSDDYFDAGAGGDRLWGGAGDDDLHGGAGNDVVYWLVDGHDRADGGSGQDRLIVSGTDDSGTSRSLGVMLDRGTATEFAATSGTFGNFGLEALLASLGTASVYEITGARLDGEPLSTVNSLSYSNFEIMDVIGSDSGSDLAFYDGGNLYWGGGGAATDLFVANLADETEDLFFDAEYADGTTRTSASGETLSNTYDFGLGAQIGGFERLGLVLGSGDDRAYGGQLSDVLIGGAGNDTLHSGGARQDNSADIERIFGGAGDDELVYTRGGASWLDGGVGTDSATYEGFDAAVYHSLLGEGIVVPEHFARFAAGNLQTFAQMQAYQSDRAFYPVTGFGADAGTDGGGLRMTNIENIEALGTEFDDVLAAGSGASALFGQAGDDVLISGAGDDLLVGGSGRDRYVFLEDFGDDVIAGEDLQGGDLYFLADTGQIGYSTLGSDLTVHTQQGSVRIVDYDFDGDLEFNIHTASDPDGSTIPVLVPGNPSRATAQIHVGTSAKDIFTQATAGFDHYVGGAGNDEMPGSAGSDIFNGGPGVDIVDFSGSTQEHSVDLVNQRTGGGATGDTFAGVEGLIAGSGAAGFYGDSRDNVFVGSTTDDTLYGRGGEDLLIGFDGADALRGGLGDDSLFGDAGDDTLFGGDGDDYIDGGAGADQLRGTKGDDTLQGGAGSDTLNGEAGDDVLLYGGADDPNTTAIEDGIDVLVGDLADRDTADFSHFNAAIDADLNESTDSARARTAPDGSRLAAAATIAHISGVRDLIGTNFDDRLHGNASDNQVEGGRGDDTLFGAGGMDTLTGGQGFDIVDYSTVLTGFGLTVSLNGEGLLSDVYVSETDRDTLWEIEGAILTAENDFFNAGPDGGYASGQAGDDGLYGGTGDDVLMGGAGDDTIDGGAGLNIYSAADGLSAVSIDLATRSFSDGHGGTDTVLNVRGAAGTDYADSLFGDHLPNVLHGGDGPDLMRGGGGPDTLDGGEGNDTLEAGVPLPILVKPQTLQVNLRSEALLLDSIFTQEAVPGAPGLRHATVVARAHGDGGAGGQVELYAVTVNEGDTLTFDIDDASFDPMIYVTRKGVQFNVAQQEDAETPDDGVARNPYFSHTFNVGGLHYIEVRDEDNVNGGPGPGQTYTLHVGYDDGPFATQTPGAVMLGGAGNDLINGNAGDDHLSGGDGFDWINAGGGSDRIDGGADRDMVSFVAMTDSVGRSNVQYRLDIDLAAGTAVSSGNETITLTGVEQVTGTIFADRFTGDAGDNRFRGLGDYDWFNGSGGADTYEGGTGRDMVSYVASAQAVVVDLARGGLAGMATGDSYDSVERVTGSIYADTLYGDGGENGFRGLGGYDTFIGSSGGRERYDGGSGLDTVSYHLSDAGVIASLLRGYGNGGDAARDLYTSIENLGGTSYADVLTGDNGRNNLRGLYGEDTLIGNGGIDRLAGGKSDDWLYGGSGSDFALFDGHRGEFTITRTGTRDSIVSWTGSGVGEGTDRLFDVEYLVFDDQTLDIWSL